MKKVLLSAGAATALLTGSAFAADLPRRAAPPVFVPVPVFTWTGAYFGINAGYAFSDRQTARTRAFDPTDTVTTDAIGLLGAESVRFEQQGFTGGGQVGYNYQFTPGAGVVVGLEADAQYTDLKKTRGLSFTQNFDAGPAGNLDGNIDNISRQKLEFLGTVRGRLGYAFDRVLVYGTGGFAYGQVDFTTNTAFGFTGTGIYAPSSGVLAENSGRYNKIQTGYVYGGGIEYALPTDSFLNFFNSSAVTIKAEFLHYDLGTKDVVGFFTPTALAGGGDTVPATVTRIKTEGNLVRAGLNYKFGSY